MRYPVSNFTSVCFYMYTYPQPPTGPRPLPLFVTRIAPRGAGIEAKSLKALRLGTDTASICVKIGVFLWCFRNSGEFLQQGCINTTPAHEVSHFYHTPSRTCTRAHTHARHTSAQAHTRPGASAHTQAQPRKRVPFPHEKRNQKRITPRIT